MLGDWDTGGCDHKSGSGTDIERFRSMPRHCKDRLWMELDAFNRKLSVADAHYLIVIDRLSSNIEAFRQTPTFRYKRMVSRSLERVFDSTENPFSVVPDGTGLAVTRFPGSNYLAAERVNNPLVSQAYAQCWGLAAHFTEDSCARPKVSRVAGAARAR